MNQLWLELDLYWWRYYKLYDIISIYRYLISHWYLRQYKSNSNRSWFIRLPSLRASKWPIYCLIIYKIGEDQWSWRVLGGFSGRTSPTRILQGSGRVGRFLTRSPDGLVSKASNPTRPWLMISLSFFIIFLVYLI